MVVFKSIKDGCIMSIDNLDVYVKRSSDGQGYIVDAVNNYTGDVVNSMTIWNDDVAYDGSGEV